MQGEAQDDYGNHECQPLETQNDEWRSSTNNEIELYAGVSAQHRSECEQRHRFANKDQQTARELVETIPKRHTESDRRQHEIGCCQHEIGLDDPITFEIFKGIDKSVKGIDEGVDRRS